MSITPNFVAVNPSSTETEKKVPAYPGIRLTNVDPAQVLPNKPELSLQRYINQVPKQPPATVEATHISVAAAIADVLGTRLVKIDKGGWMVWKGGTWELGDDTTAEKVVTRLITRRRGKPRVLIPYSMRKATNADLPGLIASGEIVDIGGTWCWKSDNSPVTHIPVAADEWSETTTNVMHIRRALAAQVQRLDARFDADPTILNCKGTVLELHPDNAAEPVTVRPLLPEDFVSRSTAVEFNPGVSRELWDRVVAEALPDPEVREYFQMAAGMSLFGKPRDHVFFVLRGRGRNAKSMLMERLVKALGDYAADAAVQLIEAGSDRHPTELMQVKGRRLVTCLETQQGKRWDTNRLKSLSGGDTQVARSMGKDFEQIIPTHTLWIASNNRPVVTEPDPALFERLREIPFTQQWYAPDAPEEEREGRVGEADLGLPDRLDSTQGEAILSWMVEGWCMYVANGGKLTYPEAVKEAGCDARSTATTWSIFVREAFGRGTDSDYVKVPEVFEAWKAYKASESSLQGEKPSRACDIGDALMREFNYANFVPRRNGHDVAKTFGLKWTELGQKYAGLTDTTKTLRPPAAGVDSGNNVVAFGLSRAKKGSA